MIIRGPLPEATPTESDRRIMSDLVGFGRIRSDLVVFGRIWPDLVGFGRIWSDSVGLVGFSRIQSDLVGVAPGRGPYYEKAMIIIFPITSSAMQNVAVKNGESWRHL